MKKSAISRREILDAAARLFRAQGYAAATMRDIAELAGIKAGSVYYYFASKEAILAEVLDSGLSAIFARVKEAVDALPAGADPRKRIETAIQGHLAALLQYGDYTSAYIRIHGQIPAEARRASRPLRAAYARYWDELFLAARRAGLIRGDIDLRLLRLFTLGGLNWTVEWYRADDGAIADLARHWAGVVFDGVMPASHAMRRPKLLKAG
jgi:TetR/AcrR family transcriptional regulator, cholesterol catabolism regulator